MKDFWNQRYADKEFAYGVEPNKLFKKFIDLEKPGKILLPADGEGRNSVYAAKKGWICHSYDYSENARIKALQLAKLNHVKIDYKVMEHKDLLLEPGSFDAVALISVQIEPNERKELHSKAIECLRPGGMICLQAFSTKQVDMLSGGPKDINRLYTKETIEEDFESLAFISIFEKAIVIEEGKYHHGNAWVIDLIAKKRY